MCASHGPPRAAKMDQRSSSSSHKDWGWSHWVTQGPSSLSRALRRAWKAWKEVPDSRTKSPGALLYSGFPMGAVKVGSKGKEDWKALVAPRLRYHTPLYEKGHLEIFISS